MANEDLLLRQMPHSLEGEQAVLGSMLIDEGCVKDVMDKLVAKNLFLSFILCIVQFGKLF